jgi:hypothetical protein
MCSLDSIPATALFIFQQSSTQQYCTAVHTPSLELYNIDEGALVVMEEREIGANACSILIHFQF